MPEWISIIVGLGFVGVVLWLALAKKKPDSQPFPVEPEPEPTKPCIALHGIAVRPQAFPQEFDPTKFPPFHYPLGLAMCFEALVDDCDPYDYLKVARYMWTVHWSGVGVVTTGTTLNPQFCWSGEGVGACCGQTAPIPMVVRVVAELTNGDVLDAKREFWLVPHTGWKK